MRRAPAVLGAAWGVALLGARQVAEALLLHGPGSRPADEGPQRTSPTGSHREAAVRQLDLARVPPARAARVLTDRRWPPRRPVRSTRGDRLALCPSLGLPGRPLIADGREGIFAITPVEPSVWGGYYEPGTLIWRNRWTTTSTRVECRDALALPANEHRTIVLRTIEAIEQAVTLRLVLDLRAEFGAQPMHGLHRDNNGVWTATSGDLWARLTGAGDADVRDGKLVAQITVPAGGHHHLMLELSDRPLILTADPETTWTETHAAWQAAVPDLGDSLAPADARHSYAVLHGLTTPGGGMVAAATLGLPERAEQGRNYDYRYVWLRDQTYAGIACGVSEPLPLFHDAVALVTARMNEHGPDIAPAYRVDGTTLPHESTLDLSGYPGGADVVGNWVNNQHQLDALGEILQLLGTALAFDVLDRHGQRGPRPGRPRHRATLARAGRRHLGTGQPVVDPLPPRLRRRPEHRRIPPTRRQVRATADASPKPS